jgi:aryl-alcohol dehydrogenase-like predicted oxidoreductase
MNADTKLDSSDFRSTLPRFTPEAMKANQALVDLLSSIADGRRPRRRRSRSRGCWRRSRGSCRSRAPRRLHRLDENIGAVSVELTPDDLRDVAAAASKITVQGARYRKS